MRRLIMLLLLLWLVTGSAAPGRAQDGADALPLLSPGLHLGVIYSAPENNPAAQTVLEAALGELIQAGLSAYQLSISWSDLEPAPGVIDTARLEEMLRILDALNLQPYLSITTINTTRLTLPRDLMAAGEAELAEGRRFDDPAITGRFAAVLDTVVPLLVAHNGFFVSVGNEVDGWLESRPAEAPGFVGFVAAARDHAHQIEPRLGVGATLTLGGVERNWAYIGDLLAVSDAAAFTYYPLNADFSVRDPSVAGADLARMVNVAGGLPVLLQEVGYPAGYLPDPSNGSSVEMQRAFVENFFAEVGRYPAVRFVSVLQLSDWSAAVCDLFVQYYTGVPTSPRMHEFLCSLGLREFDGTPKPAYDAFLAAVREIAAR